MRCLYALILFFLPLHLSSQPSDCDDRLILATLQVLYADCDSTILEAYPTGNPDLQWYVNGVAASGSTGRVFRFIGPADGFRIGIQVSNERFCSFSEQQITIATGCPVEDCTNGIDDDGNGLVDLNDGEDCDCRTPPDRLEGNLFPNPGFEIRRDRPDCEGCYSAGQQFPCVAGWQPGNSITTIEHVLECYSASISSPFLPYVAGTNNSSLIGGFAAYDSLEFATLESALVPLIEPTVPGATYRITFEADLAGGDIFNIADEQFEDVFQEVAWYYSATLDSFPYRFLNTRESVLGGSWENWMALDSVSIKVDRDYSFQLFSIEFTAPLEPIRAMVFAGAFTQPNRGEYTQLRGDYEIYWALDNVQLQRINPPLVLAEDLDATVTLRQIRADAGTDACANGLLLSVPADPLNTYQWYREGVAILGATQASFSLAFSEIDGAAYRVRVERNGTCKISDPSIARRPAPFQVDFTLDSLRCGGVNNGGIQVDLDPLSTSASYQWEDSQGEMLSSASLVTGLGPGNYTLIITDSLDCQYPYAIDLPAPPPPLQLATTATDVSCNDLDGLGEVSLQPSGGQLPYSVVVADFVGPPPPTLRLPPGDYLPTINDAAGCQALGEPFRIEEVTPFSLSLSVDREQLRLGEVLSPRLSSNRDLSTADIFWSPLNWFERCAGCLTPSVAPTRSEQVVVTVTDRDGCIRSDSIFIQLIPERKVYLPNAFSPNGDGVNDILRVYPGPSVSRVEELKVFDRWGNLLYTGRGENAFWDGHSQDGTKLRPGIFLYLAEVLFIDGVVKHYTGEVVLVD